VFAVLAGATLLVYWLKRGEQHAADGSQPFRSVPFVRQRRLAPAADAERCPGRTMKAVIQHRSTVPRG
jgi:hypothetical protein